MSSDLSDRLFRWLRTNQFASAKEVARALGADRSEINSILYAEQNHRSLKIDGQPPRWKAIDGDESASKTEFPRQIRSRIAASTTLVVVEAVQIVEQSIDLNSDAIESTEIVKKPRINGTSWLFPQRKGFRRRKNGGPKAVTEDWLELQPGGKCSNCLAKIPANAMACPECASPECVDIDERENSELMASGDNEKEAVMSEDDSEFDSYEETIDEVSE